MRGAVIDCTPALFNQAVDSVQTARVCAAIADAWESVKRGEMSREDFETYKGEQKKRLAVFTPHATFEGGARRIAKAVPSGLSMYDVDHIPDPRGYYETKVASRLEELGIVLAHVTPSTEGLRLFFIIPQGMTLTQAQEWMSRQLGDETYDTSVKDLARCSFVVPRSYILYICEEKLFANIETLKATEVALNASDDVLKVRSAHAKEGENSDADLSAPQGANSVEQSTLSAPAEQEPLADYQGIPYAAIIDKWFELYNNGALPVRSNRNTLTFELAVNLRHICGFDRALMDRVIPCFDGFPEAEKLACIDSALSEKRTQMPKRLKEVLALLQEDREKRAEAETDNECDDETKNTSFAPDLSRITLPMGIRDSVESAPEGLGMPVLTAICPVIGMLATGVRLDVHGTVRGLNLIAYVAGDFASGKGSIDPVVKAWTDEVHDMDKMYLMQEDEWRAKKRAAKNKKEQPEEPKLPIRLLTLNNTVANLAERLGNTDGRHAFSFTPEADTVAQKWRSAMSDFSVMLRQAYDGTGYDREARSADAVTVHIDHLLWNVTLCGTPDALFRVVNNYTDGFQSRLAIARTPDNTFSPLEDNPRVMSDLQREHIRQVAHLLPLLAGDVTLPKLEERGRLWLEHIRLETMKNDDRVRARQRFRICVTAQRMTCCVMLCHVVERLIKVHGLASAEKMLKQKPDLWRGLLLKAQTPRLLDAYDVIADSLLDNALYFFRDRIECAFSSRDYAGTSERVRPGKNDSIFERLDNSFSVEQAYQQTFAVKGAAVSRNQVHMMLKNWRRQGLVSLLENGSYRKCQDCVGH